MLEVKFYENIDEDLLKFAVIVSKYKNKWVYCKHKKRDTYEIPGGRREANEDIYDTAQRELYEETGATRFDLQKIGVYSVLNEGVESFGMLYFARIKEFGEMPDTEIEKIILCDEMPMPQTYPLIQPKLMEKVMEVLGRQKFIPEEEIILNKKVMIREKEGLLLSLTKGADANKLWVLYRQDSKGNTIAYERDYATNREELIDHIKRSRSSQHIPMHISEMTLQGQRIRFNKSSVGSLEYLDEEEQGAIDYFMEQGLITKEWDEVPLKEMIIGRYEQCEEELFPKLDLTKDLGFTLKISGDSREVLIQHPLMLPIEKEQEHTKIFYKDEETQEENYFYLNEIEKCDWWQKNLEAKPEHHASSTSLVFSCKSETGINGYPKKVELLKPVEKDFEGPIEVELFSKYVQIPEEVIICESHKH